MRGIAGLWMDDAYGLGSKGERGGRFRGETKFVFGGRFRRIRT